VDDEVDRMQLREATWRDALGQVVIQSRVRNPTDRKDFEKKFLLPSIEVGLAGWHRAHSQGAITGRESPHAIRYAPAEVNQSLMAMGIERYIKELYELLAPDAELWLTTTTATHAGTLRLKEIQYKLEATCRGAHKVLFESWIAVESDRLSPTPHFGVQARALLDEWKPFLKPVAERPRNRS
jgi:hypothetical protein